MGYKQCPNVTKVVRKQTVKLVNTGHICRKQDNNSTINTNWTTSTNRRSIFNKGGTFTVTEKDDGEEEEEEDLALHTYKEYLCKNGVIALNIGETDLLNLELDVSKFLTRQNQPRPRVYYLLTLENGRFRAEVVLRER